MRVTVRVKDLRPGDITCGSHQKILRTQPSTEKGKTLVVTERGTSSWGSSTTMLVERTEKI